MVLLTLVDPDWAIARKSMNAEQWARRIAEIYLSPISYPDYTGALRFDLQLPYPVTAWLACCALMPVLLLILPRTRAMVKVRPAHVLRAAVYSAGLLLILPLNLFISSVLMTFPFIRSWYYALSWGQYDRSPLIAQGVGALIGVGWFALWWWIVLVRVFALPNGRWVWATLMLACLLAAVAVAALDMQFALLVFG
jgi:hypothetical protein